MTPKIMHGRIASGEDPAPVSGQNDFSLMRRLIDSGRAYLPLIVLLFFLNLLAAPLALLVPLPLMIAVDSAIGTQPLPGMLAWLLPASVTAAPAGILAVAAGLGVLIALLQQAQNFGSSMLQSYAGEMLVKDFRTRLFGHVQRLSLSYHDAKGTADAIYRIQYDATSIQSVMLGFGPLIASGLTLAGMVYVTARIDGMLALIALSIMPFLFLLTHRLGPRLKHQWHEIKKLESHSMAVVQESLTALRVVKAFGQEDREQARFVDSTNRRVRALLGVNRTESGAQLLVGLLIACGTAAALYVGVTRVHSGALTLGQLLMVMGYLGQLYGPLRSSSKNIASLQKSLASAERAFRLLAEAPEVIERADARPLGRAEGAIELRDVSFAYGDNTPVLQEISFKVEPGARVGIVGRTGVGKSTLASLLTRFYDPVSGEILLDGVDLRDCRLADLRNQFGIVLQEPVLFSTSVAENIAYGRRDAGMEDVVAAAKAANAHGFITALPDGYETLVGERGMRLSGGERQRVGLARAFLKDAPILILDEPTSAVDTRTEGEIIAAMERLMRGRTTFMIAHRLSTLEKCDLLLSLERGRLESISTDVPEALAAAAKKAQLVPSTSES